jgi:hypothetical protein
MLCWTENLALFCRFSCTQRDDWVELCTAITFSTVVSVSCAEVIASLMWQRCTLVPVLHCPACEQTQAYTSDVSKARIASIFRTSYSVSCDFPAKPTAAGLLFDIDATRDRGSTWQHGYGPEGKIRGRWGQFAIPVSVT